DRAAVSRVRARDGEALALILGEARRIGLDDEVLEQLAELRALLVGSGAPVAAEGELGDGRHVEMLVEQRAEASLALRLRHGRIGQLLDGVAAERLHESARRRGGSVGGR